MKALHHFGRLASCRSRFNSSEGTATLESTLFERVFDLSRLPPLVLPPPFGDPFRALSVEEALDRALLGIWSNWHSTPYAQLPF